MKVGSLLALAGFGAAAAGAACLGARYRRNINRDSWFRELDKPSFTPPDTVFPLVWTAFYATTALVRLANLERGAFAIP